MSKERGRKSEDSEDSEDEESEDEDEDSEEDDSRQKVCSFYYFSPLETISTSLWASLHHHFPVPNVYPSHPSARHRDGLT